MILTTRLTCYCFVLGCTFCLSAATTFGQENPSSEFRFSLEIANPNPVGSGARALGQGNAFIAVADDATAASWNPAGLMQLQVPEFSFAFEALSQSNQVNARTRSNSEGRDSFSLEEFNYASIVLPVYLDTNMVFSLNYLRLFRFDDEMKFPVFRTSPTGAGVSTTDWVYDFDQHGSFSVVAPSFAISLLKNLAFGITLNIWNHDLTQSSRFKKKEFTSGTTTLRNSMNDVIETITLNYTEINELEVDEGYSFVLGSLLRLNENWNIGLVVKPKFDLDLDQKVRIKNLDETGSASIDIRETKGAELDMPMIIGAGVAWRANDSWTVSTDATWTRWSEFTFVDKKTKVVKNPLTGQSPSEDELEDTFTIRAGCEYYLIRETYLIPFRFGLGYDPAPAVNDVDDYYTINCGTGIQIGSYNLDIAYEFRWGNNVNGSSLQPINATQDVYRHRVLASLIYYF